MTYNVGMPDIFDAATHSDPKANTKLQRVNEYSRVMRHEKPTSNPFKAFMAKPRQISFDSQGQEEKILLLLRRHPITQVKWILITLVLIFTPWLFMSIGLLNFLPPNYQLATLVGWYMLVISYVLESVLNWFYNVYLITDERVIDVDFQDLIHKNISSAKIDAIEDISAKSGGLLASIFDFGTIQIQTAGAMVEFEFADVPQPAKVTEFLNEMLLEEEKEKMEDRAE